MRLVLKILSEDCFSKLKSFSYTFSPFEYNDYSANNEARRPPISIFLTDLSIGYVPQTL